MSHPTIIQNGALLDAHRQSRRRGHPRRGKPIGARSARQAEGNVGAADLYLADEEIAEIEGKNEKEPELVTAA